MSTDDDETQRDGDKPTRVVKPQRRDSISRARLPERYEVTALLGEGGMGEVLEARDEVIGREVAIKRMLESSPTEEQTRRFMREARIQGTLDHPAIPPVHELAHDAEGRPYFVMKRLKGTTLSKIIAEERDKYPRERLLRAFADVCLAVELAHTRGIVHRDLKPANIMLGEFGEVFVLDWGVAKIIGETDPTMKISKVPTPPLGSTQHGVVIGTPGYMAPEQQAAMEIDGRADVYALGCILFEILSGKKMKVLGLDRPSRADPAIEVPPELDDLVVEATTMMVQARLGTARALGERVQHYLDGDRDLALRTNLAKEHLARAMRASQLRDEEGQRVAIQEAARALALDPQLPGAAELVGRLMLEPPATMPPEVEAELAVSDLTSWHKLAKVSSMAYVSYASFIPVMLWIGMRDLRYLLAYAGLLGVMAVVAGLAGRRRFSTPLLVALVVGNAALIALLSRMYTPFLIAPGVAAMNVMILTGTPGFRETKRVVLLLLALALGILTPWILELVGAVDKTIEFTAERMTLLSPALENNVMPIQIGFVLYVLGLLSSSAMIRRAHAEVEETSRRQLHLHAWKMRQLVPA